MMRTVFLLVLIAGLTERRHLLQQPNQGSEHESLRRLSTDVRHPPDQPMRSAGCAWLLLDACNGHGRRTLNRSHKGPLRVDKRDRRWTTFHNAAHPAFPTVHVGVGAGDL